MHSLLMSIHVARTQIALCLCMNAPFSKTNVNESTDQGALVACYSCFRTTKASVGTSKELTETTTRAFRECFQFVPI